MTPDNFSPTATTDTPAPSHGRSHAPAIIGYIDGIRDRRVFGWAWNQANPADVVEIELRLDDTTVARIPADRLRRDLMKGGIGDGRHAFEATLAEPLPPDQRHRLRAFATCPGLDAPVPLMNRAVALAASSPDQTSPVVAPANVERWLSEFSAIQHNFEAALRSVATEVRLATEQRATTVAEEVAAIAAATATLREGLDHLTEQLRSVELFQARLDQTAAQLIAAQSDAVGGSTFDRRLHVAVGLVAALSLLALGIGIWAVL